MCAHAAQARPIASGNDPVVWHVFGAFPPFFRPCASTCLLNSHLHGLQSAELVLSLKLHGSTCPLATHEGLFAVAKLAESGESLLAIGPQGSEFRV